MMRFHRTTISFVRDIAPNVGKNEMSWDRAVKKQINNKLHLFIDFPKRDEHSASENQVKS